MPIWSIKCECGCRDSDFLSLASRERFGGQVPCGLCGKLNDVRPTAPVVKAPFVPIPGGGGKLFRSAKEIDDYAEKTDTVPVIRGSQEYKDIEAQVDAGADEQAQRFGYTGVAQMRRLWSKEKRDHSHDVQNKKIDQYHNEHGTAGRVPVEKTL